MITTYLLKTIAVFITLIILWCIAKRQEELGNEIEVLKEKEKYPLFTVNATVPTINIPPIVLDKEPSFNQKKAAEEKRMCKLCKEGGFTITPCPHHISQATKKVTKKKSVK